MSDPNKDVKKLNKEECKFSERLMIFRWTMLFIVDSLKDYGINVTGMSAEIKADDGSYQAVAALMPTEESSDGFTVQ